MSDTPTPMQIREGAYYRTRGGDVVGPVKHKGFMSPDDQHPFFFLGLVYDSQGRHKSSFERQNDLISEVYVSDTPPADVLTLPSAMLKPQDWRRLKPIEPSPETKTLRDEFAIAIVMALLSRPLSDNDLTPERCKIVWDNATAMMEARRK